MDVCPAQAAAEAAQRAVGWKWSRVADCARYNEDDQFASLLVAAVCAHFGAQSGGGWARNADALVQCCVCINVFPGGETLAAMRCALEHLRENSAILSTYHAAPLCTCLRVALERRETRAAYILLELIGGGDAAMREAAVSGMGAACWAAIVAAFRRRSLAQPALSFVFHMRAHLPSAPVDWNAFAACVLALAPEKRALRAVTAAVRAGMPTKHVLKWALQVEAGQRDAVLDVLVACEDAGAHLSPVSLRRIAGENIVQPSSVEAEESHRSPKIARVQPDTETESRETSTRIFYLCEHASLRGHFCGLAAMEKAALCDKRLIERYENALIHHMAAKDAVPFIRRAIACRSFPNLMRTVVSKEKHPCWTDAADALIELCFSQHCSDADYALLRSHCASRLPTACPEIPDAPVCRRACFTLCAETWGYVRCKTIASPCELAVVHCCLEKSSAAFVARECSEAHRQCTVSEPLLNVIGKRYAPRRVCTDEALLMDVLMHVIENAKSSEEAVLAALFHENPYFALRRAQLSVAGPAAEWLVDQPHGRYRNWRDLGVLATAFSPFLKVSDAADERLPRWRRILAAALLESRVGRAEPLPGVARAPTIASPVLDYAVALGGERMDALRAVRRYDALAHLVLCGPLCAPDDVDAALAIASHAEAPALADVHREYFKSVSRAIGRSALTLVLSGRDISRAHWVLSLID